MSSMTTGRFSVPKKQYDDVVLLYRHYRRGFVAFAIAVLAPVALGQILNIESAAWWTTPWLVTVGVSAGAYGVMPYRARIAALVRRVARWFRLIP
jgi:hypothetical protein